MSNKRYVKLYTNTAEQNLLADDVADEVDEGVEGACG
jgi:hypothetical protein